MKAPIWATTWWVMDVIAVLPLDWQLRQELLPQAPFRLIEVWGALKPEVQCELIRAYVECSVRLAEGVDAMANVPDPEPAPAECDWPVELPPDERPMPEDPEPVSTADRLRACWRRLVRTLTGRRPDVVF